MQSCHHFVCNFGCFSSLPHCTRASNGKYRNVYHFDSEFITVPDVLLLTRKLLIDQTKPMSTTTSETVSFLTQIYTRVRPRSFPVSQWLKICVGWFSENTWK
jgi:hypothetical protein